MTDMTASETLRKKFMNPAGPARAGIAVVALFFLVMLGWGALAPLSGAVIANGVLQVEGGRKAVQHPYGGVVTKLLVAEGDHVEAGQVLMRLSDAEPRAERDVLAAQYDSLLAAQGRLSAERDSKPDPAFAENLTSRADDPGVRDAMMGEAALMAARTQQFVTSQNVVTEQKGQLAEKARAAEAQIASLNSQRASLAGELEGAKTLLADQLIERNRVQQMERNISELDAQIAVQKADLTAADKAMAETDYQMAGLERDRITRVNEELRINRAELAALEPKLNAARDAFARTDILATATGTIVGLSIQTEGGVVAAGAELMTIVPDQNPLIVEAQMRLADITDVTEGTRADVRLLAVPAIQRPALSGNVQTISADRVTDERTGQSYYALRVALDPQQAAATGVDLQPGMPVQLVIPTRDRTMVDYLISPLLDELSGAFREK